MIIYSKLVRSADPIKGKLSRKDLALSIRVAYTTYIEERVTRAMVAEKEVRFLYESCCNGEKQGLLVVE